MGWSATQIDHKTEDDKTNNGEDLDGGEPKLAFAEGAGTQKVDNDNHDAGNGDPRGVVDLAIPICNGPQALSVLSGACGEMIGWRGQDAQLMRTAAADNSAGRVMTHEYQ